MRKKILGIALLACYFAAIPSFGQGHRTGLKFDDYKYGRQPKLGFGMAFSADDRPSVSLRPYCPTPGDQGNVSSCVGWATGYGAATIAYCIKNGITEQAQKNKIAFSSMYLYLHILPPGGDCSMGTHPADAVAWLKEKGDCLVNSFNPPNCNIAPQLQLDAEAARFKIKDYGRLFEPTDNADAKIVATIKSLSANKPVIIGMFITGSFETLRDQYYRATDKHDVKGGHAMVVVGYDNMDRTFEIMNSWGTNWGKDGFFKISYDDYADLVKYGFQINLGGGAEEKNIAGDFHFKRYKATNDITGERVFEDVKPTLNGGIYSVAIKRGEYFRVAADDLTKDSYVYVFSLKPDKSVEILYPTDKSFFGFTNVTQIPRVIAKDAVITIPNDKDGGFTSDQSGEDYLCVLYSSKLIDNIQELVTNVKNSTAPDFYGKLSGAFGNILVPADRIQYNTAVMGAKASVGSAYVVPLILKAQVQ